MGDDLSLKIEKINGGFVNDFFGELPEGFIANALALTSPRDAGRLSSVGSVFQSASEWDAVWESFIPSDYQKVAAEEAAADGGGGRSMKELYLHLCDHPLIIEGGNKSFSLDKWSGKKCYMLAPRHLTIGGGDTPSYWRWISTPESRFAEVVELINVIWLDIHGKISTCMLSLDTHYVAYFVFKLTPKVYGFGYHPVEVSMGLGGLECQTNAVYLDPEARQMRRCLPRRRGIGVFNRGAFAYHEQVATPTEDNCPTLRGDGWLEVKIGEYFNKKGVEADLEMSVTEATRGNWKGGLIVQGIEIRPKDCK